MKSTFARRMSILLVLAMVLAMLPVGALAADTTTLYLQPSSNWKEASARFAAYFFNASGNTWVDMTDADADGVYEVTVPEGDWTNVIFCRMNPNDASNSWTTKWNQTADLSIPTDDKILFVAPAGVWDSADDSNWVSYTVGDEVTEATTAPKNYSYYVIGSMNSWALADDALGMSDTDGDGIYSVVVALEAGSYEYKINVGDWSQDWGNGETKANYTLSLAEACDVTFTLNPTTGEVTATGDGLGDAPAVENPIPEGTILNVKGNFGGLDWVAENETGLMTLVDGVYTLTIADVPASEVGAEAYQFKIMFNNSWETAYPSENWSFYLTDVCDVTITIDATYQTINATADYMTFDAPTEGGDDSGETTDPETPVLTGAYVKGTIPGMDWDLTSTAGAMTLVDGIYTLTIPSVAASEVGAAAYEFKVVVDGSWDTAYPESNWTFYLSDVCDVVITYNPADNAVTLNAEYLTYDAPTDGTEDPVDPPVTDTTYYVAGSMNEWSAAAEGYAMTAVGDGTYTYTFTALAAGTYSLKVTDGTWDNSWTAAEGDYLGTDGNLYFTVTEACDVVVTFNGTNVSVSGSNVYAKAPEALVVDKVVIAGGVTGDDTANPGNMFNGLIWAVNADYYVNCLYDTEDAPGVYSITFMNVAAGSYDFKFVVNDNWSINYASGLAIESGVATTAWFNASGNSTVVVAEDGSTVTFVLDLTNTAYVGDNASMTVTVEVPEKVESSAPETLVLGGNKFVIGDGDVNAVTSTYTAAADGVLYIEPTAMATSWDGVMNEVPPFYIGMQFMNGYGILVDGVQLLIGNPVEVVAGTTYEIGVISNFGNGAEITLNLCTGHTYVDGACTVCGLECTNHNWVEGTCENCGATCDHETWNGAYCANCGAYCEHSWTYTYVKGTSHTFTCSGLCGQTISVADTDSKKLQIVSAAPVLSDNIVLKYRCNIPAGFSEPYMVFTFNGENYYDFNYTIDESDGRYAFLFPEINPQKMGDNVCATLYAMVDGTYVSVQIANYSMLKYCDNTLKKTTIDAATRTLYSDVLAYGAAAQIMMDYKTDALVTDLLSATATLTPSTFPGLDDSFNLQKRTGDAHANVSLTGVTVALGSKVKLRYSVTCTDLEAFTFKVELNGRTYTYTGSDLVETGTANKYYLYFDEIKAKELSDLVVLTVWEGETQVGHTIEYSVNTYVYKNYANTAKSEAERNLMMALYNYGESTKNA